MPPRSRLQPRATLETASPRNCWEEQNRTRRADAVPNKAMAATRPQGYRPQSTTADQGCPRAAVLESLHIRHASEPARMAGTKVLNIGPSTQRLPMRVEPLNSTAVN